MNRSTETPVEDTASATGQAQSQSLVPLFIVWTGQAFSLLGSKLVGFALVWYLTVSTGSATVLAFASLVTVLPRILFGPVAGALVDRWNRRIVMIVADSLIALATVVLVVLFALDVIQVWHIYVLNFVRALGGVFHWPAMQASTALMSPEKHLSRIQGMNQILFGTMSILSPAMGALLIDLLPVQGILAIDVGTALLAILPLFFVFIPQPKITVSGKGATEGKPSVLDDLRQGLHFIRGWPGLLMIIAISVLVAMLLMPAFSLLPILITGHFGGGALQLAWLQVAYGAGAIVGGLVLSVWGGFERRIVTMLLAMALMGVGFVALGVAPANGLPLAIGALFFSATMESIEVGSIVAIIQAAVPPELHGRVLALDIALVTAAAPIGLAIAGPLSNAIGVRPWFVLGGLVTTALGVGAFFVPAIIRIEDQVTRNRVKTA